MNFLISSVMILSMFAVKMFLLKTESDFLASLPAIIDITIFASLFLSGVFFYLKNNFNKKQKVCINGNKTSYIFLILTILVVIISGFINITKVSLDWDAIALYEARALFLKDGMKFSEMLSLSEFDDKNSYYYLLYPPYTSVMHYFWKYLPVTVNVSLMYTIFLFLLGISVFYLTRDSLGSTWASLLAFFSITAKDVFSTSLTEYTNLPFTLFIIVGFLLLIDYLGKYEIWKLFFGIILVGCSQWIRYLELIWLIIFITLLIHSLINRKFKKNIFPLIMLLLFSLSQYYSWSYFITKLGGIPKIFEINILSILDLIAGIFTGSLLRMLIFFIMSFGLTFVAHLSAIFYILNKENTLPPIFIGLTLIYYFVSLYCLSFVVDWWPEMSDSITRSSSFLIIISGYLIILGFKKFNNIKYLRSVLKLTIMLLHNNK